MGQQGPPRIPVDTSPSPQELRLGRGERVLLVPFFMGSRDTECEEQLRRWSGVRNCCHGSVRGLCSSVRGGCLATIQGISGAMAVEM